MFKEVTFIVGLNVVRLSADLQAEPDVNLAQQVRGPACVTSWVRGRQETEVENRTLALQLLWRVIDQLTILEPLNPGVRISEGLTRELQPLTTI